MVFTKGYAPWNKGLTYECPKLRGRPSWNSGLKGYKAGEEHHRYGRKINPLTSKKISDTVKKRWKDTIGYGMSGKCHSDEAKLKMSKAKLGEKSRTWKGGISKNKYGGGFTKCFRDKVRTAHGWICVMSLEKHNILHVHHIDCNKSNHSPDNLMPLRADIHMMIHADEGFWNGTVYLNRKGVIS